MTETADVRTRAQVRGRALDYYWNARDREGMNHHEAALVTMHEVRDLSEDNLWEWIKGDHRPVPPDFPELMPSAAHAAEPSPAAERALRAAGVSPRDDSETALAPESGGWTFDSHVAAAFDDMLIRSIPNYEDMRRFVTRAALWHADKVQISPSIAVGIVDLGASRGTGLQPILDSFGVRGRYVAAETSPPMVEVLRDRFSGMIEAEVVKVWDGDLRRAYPVCSAAVAATLSVLTLQFIPIEYRQRLLRTAYEQLAPGGVFILVEKVLGSGTELDECLVDLYYDVKRGNGYTQEAIDRKRLSLEGVLVPLTASMNEELLRAAGFDAVDVGWAWANFRGWLAVKR